MEDTPALYLIMSNRAPHYMSFVDNEGLHPGYEEDIEAIKAGTLIFRAIKAKKAAEPPAEKAAGPD